MLIVKKKRLINITTYIKLRTFVYQIYLRESEKLNMNDIQNT